MARPHTVLPTELVGCPVDLVYRDIYYLDIYELQPSVQVIDLPQLEIHPDLILLDAIPLIEVIDLT